MILTVCGVIKVRKWCENPGDDFDHGRIVRPERRSQLQWRCTGDLCPEVGELYFPVFRLIHAAGNTTKAVSHKRCNVEFGVVSIFNAYPFGYLWFPLWVSLVLFLWVSLVSLVVISLVVVFLVVVSLLAVSLVVASLVVVSLIVFRSLWFSLLFPLWFPLWFPLLWFS